MQNFKINSHSVPKIERKQTDIGNCITSHSNVVGWHLSPKKFQNKCQILWHTRFKYLCSSCRSSVATCGLPSRKWNLALARINIGRLVDCGWKQQLAHPRVAVCCVNICLTAHQVEYGYSTDITLAMLSFIPLHFLAGGSCSNPARWFPQFSFLINDMSNTNCAYWVLKYLVNKSMRAAVRHVYFILCE